MQIFSKIEYSGFNLFKVMCFIYLMQPFSLTLRLQMPCDFLEYFGFNHFFVTSCRF